MLHDHQKQLQPWMKRQCLLQVVDQAAAKSAILGQRKNHNSLHNPEGGLFFAAVIIHSVHVATATESDCVPYLLIHTASVSARLSYPPAAPCPRPSLSFFKITPDSCLTDFLRLKAPRSTDESVRSRNWKINYYNQ